MNNEETILDPQYGNAESKSNETKGVEQPKAEEKKKKKNVGRGEKAAYAAGGAVVGAGMTMAGQAVAATSAEKVELPEESEEQEGEDVLVATAASPEETSTVNETAEEVSGVTVVTNGTTVHVVGEATIEVENGSVHVSSVQPSVEQPVSDMNTQEQQAAPEPEDAIVATATGVRVAQVNDDASFSQAFADARAQVGPGGVFEWHGRVYGTYYKDEWDNMTAEEKHEYQSSIDYNDVLSNDNTAQNNADYHDSDVHYASHHDQEYVSPEDVNVQVLGIGQTDLDDNGIPENAVVLEIDGHEMLIVDIDQDGKADVAFCDVDNDGEWEAADLRNENVPMPEQSAGDAYMAQAETNPDYMNDANVDLFEI